VSFVSMLKKTTVTTDLPGENRCVTRRGLGVAQPIVGLKQDASALHFERRYPTAGYHRFQARSLLFGQVDDVPFSHRPHGTRMWLHGKRNFERYAAGWPR
jgi:hypothetical protein